MHVPQIDVILIVFQQEVLPIIPRAVGVCLFGLIFIICSLREPVLDQGLLKLGQRVKDE